MNPVKPMLAVPLAKGDIREWTDWVAEIKFDGHRLIVVVDGGKVTAFTRPRKRAGGDSKTMEVRALPEHLVKELAQLPDGTYDGELLAGDTATDVKRLDLQHEVRFVVFDLPVKGITTIGGFPWEKRRELLLKSFAGKKFTHVTVSVPVPVTSMEDVTNFAEAVWSRGGEGLMLKHRASTYQAGKRSTDWLKIKRVESAVMKVVGFEASRGTVMNRGQFAVVILEDAGGTRTTCKTLNDEELIAFEREWDQRSSVTTHTDTPNTAHPALGRMLRVDHLGRTRDGGYRGPVIWDRWEDE